MISKKEIIKELVESFGFSEEELKEKTRVEVEELLAQVKGIPTGDAASNGDADPQELMGDVQQELETVEDDGLLEVTEVQLHIHQNLILKMRGDAKRVVVENAGGGDLYVDVNSVRFHPECKLAPDEKKEFKDVQKLFVGSASRPTLRVKQFAK